jgi:hypothetical protein
MLNNRLNSNLKSTVQYIVGDYSRIEQQIEKHVARVVEKQEV